MCRFHLVRLLFILSFISTACAHFFAQKSPGFSNESSLNFTAYPELNGVQVGNIIADKNGQIWIASGNNGLYRYNGYEFKKFSYDIKDTASIKSNNIARVFEDQWKKIWISSPIDGVLTRYDPVSNKFKKYNYKHLLTRKGLDKISLIYDMSVLRGQLLFTGAYDAPMEKSIFIYDPLGDSIKIFAPGSAHPDYSYIFLPDQNGHALIIGQDAQLYGLHLPDSIYRLDASIPIQNMANQSLFFVAKYDSQNRLVVANNKAELLVFDNALKLPSQTYSFKYLCSGNLKDFSPTSIELDHDQNIWIGSFQGLFFFDRKTEQFQKLDLPLDANGNPYKIQTLLRDSFNNLWIGTLTGLLKYEAKPVFISYSAKGTDTSVMFKDYVAIMPPMLNGNVGIINFEISGQNPKISFNELNLTTNSIHRIALQDIIPKGANIAGGGEVGKDTFYFGTDRGVYQVTKKGKQVDKISLPGVPATHPGISQFFKDKYGNEWLGTANYLYKKMKGENSYTPIDLSKQPGGSEESNRVFVEDGGKYGLWIISDNGLFLYDYATNKITRHGYDAGHTKSDHSFLSQTIASAYTQDSTGIVWVGTRDGGLNKYDIRSGKVKTFTIQDGLPDLNVYNIQYDDKNEALWLATGNGLSRFDITSENFANYSSSDGINGKSFYTGMKTKDGQLLFGGDALIRFRPENIKSGAHTPIVSIQDIKVSNRSIAYTLDSINDHTLVTLGYKQNNISIDYLATHYADPKNNKYSYILENFDKEWNDVGPQHTAYYTNLPAGEYTFKVKAANSNGMWNMYGASLKIKILSPWYKTTWAYGLYLLSLLGLGSLANQYFKQRVIKQERERSHAKELEQAKEIEIAYKQLESSHESLKSTQSQLIQAEKMASLGELTAGIAHEIQNPLNFVNNFSDINIELIDEMKDELHAGNKEETIKIADTIKSNLEKITNHGRRADSIVKGMLQHSRKSTGLKEPTDINALADEYLRLAYHGLRAKDKSFNALFNTDLDPTIGLVQVIPQDIGRVFLNLITNAFHAVMEESNHRKSNNPDSTYTPLVRVSTKKLEHNIEIRIRDNGPGIQENIKDKIFQPFFTTKPTGQGTGLGLSLAYDIIKAHGGDIKANTHLRSVADEKDSKNGLSDGTEFVITLPV